MSKIVEMLRRLTGARTPPTAADLRRGEEEARAALVVAEVAVARLEGEHRAALLDAPDREVERIEGLLAAQRREAARAKAALAELGARAEAAEKREAEAALDAQIAEARQAVQRAAVRLAIGYAPQAAALARLLEQADEADRLVSAARGAALAAGRPVDHLRMVDELMQPAEVRAFAPISGSVSLRPMGDFRGHGAARHLFEGAGLSPAINPILS
jgi:leucyl aminopeptidase (aminopeptidase T)